MWKRGGRSSALDRAQALLSAKRSSRGDAPGSMQDSTAKTQGSAVVSVKTRSAPLNTHTLLSDLSDLSSVSSAPERDADAVTSANAEKNRGREGYSNRDLRPQSSLGGGSRFLKKAPPPTNSRQSPVSRSHTQQVPEPRYVSSSQHGSQTAALSRLAEIESRIRSHKQAQEHTRQGTKPTLILTPDLGLSPSPPTTQSPEAPVQLSTQSSSEQSPRGNRFLKKRAVGAAEGVNTAPVVAPKNAHVGVRSRSRAAGPVLPSGGLETKSVRVTGGVSLESDEEDMRKLLGDSIESTDYSFLGPERPSVKKPDKMFSKSSQRVQSTPPPPPAAVRPLSPSSTAPPRPSASPPRRSSPFRFTGQAQAHFSPSVLSPSPSPPPTERPGFSDRAESLQHSLSSMSGHSEVLSLEELFAVGPQSEAPHSEMSSVTCEDFKINVMTLDDLVPAAVGFTAETPEKERETKHSAAVPASPNRRQQLEDEVLDYQSDFMSESRTEPGHSASQVSEHLQGDEDEVISEVREEALDSDASRGRTDDDYSSALSETSRSDTSRTSERSQTSGSFSRSSSDSRSSASRGSRTPSQQPRRRAPARKALKEAAVQTQPDPLADTWSAGMAAVDTAVSMTYMNPPPVVAHAVSAEAVEAISDFNPAAFALNEMLKQQLAMTRRFIESSRRLHSSLVQSLEPPNYRYTTLEDTKEYIRRHRPPKLTMEEALEEVLQETTDLHCT